MDNHLSVHQSPVVPDTLLSHQSMERSGEDSDDNTSVEDVTLISTCSYWSSWRTTFKGLPHQSDLVSMPMGPDFLMQQGVPQLIACPI